MNHFIFNTFSFIKIYQHDGTILSLLYSLKVAGGDQIPYAAAIIMEIYESDVGSFEAEIYYRKNGELVPQIVLGCDQACPVEKLYEILQQNAYFSLNTVLEGCKVVKNTKDKKNKNAKKKKHDKHHKNKKDINENDH